MKKALITGITGQDGAYLTKLLLGKGYKVFGAYRRASSMSLWRIKSLGVDESEITLLPFEILEESSVRYALEVSQPDEVYNLAAQSFVGASFALPLYTSQVNAIGPLRILEAIRAVNPAIRFYQASTSEMFGNSPAPQNELTQFAPRSPYGAAKTFAHHCVVNYREAYGMHASCGILFNHESPLRGREFVTRKITNTLARIKVGLEAELKLGNMNAKRDWGFAGDYVKGMWAMLQKDVPCDYVLATGRTSSVRDFADLAAVRLGIELDQVLRISESEQRPTDVFELCGDPTQAMINLAWRPTVSLEGLVASMCEADLRRAEIEWSNIESRGQRKQRFIDRYTSLAGGNTQGSVN